MTYGTFGCRFDEVILERLLSLDLSTQPIIE